MPVATHDQVVRVVDTPTSRVHHPSDAVGAIVAAVGVVVTFFLAVYAHATTAGVAQDVQGFSNLLARLLLVPVAVLEGLVTIFIPIAVLTELALRRLGRQILEGVVAAGLALGLALLAEELIRIWGSDALVTGFSVWVSGDLTVVMPAYAAALVGILTVAGPRTRRRTVKWSWNLLWVAIGVLLVTAKVSLPAEIVTLLLGRIAGLAVRYASGVRSERAYGADLVDGVRRAGFDPTYLVRVRDLTDPASALREQVTSVERGEVTGEVDVADLRTGQHPVVVPDAPPGRPAEAIAATWDAASVALTRAGDNRVYALFTPDGQRHDVVVLDGDRQVVGWLSRFWHSVRLRGLETRTAISLRAAAERAALLTYAAHAAGVRGPRLLGMSEAEDSMVLVQEHAARTVSLRDADATLLGDDVLDEAWRQLRLAHNAGLTHRALTVDVVLVATGPDDAVERAGTVGPGDVPTDAPRVLLTGWEHGEVASSTLARRLDLAQLLAVLAIRVGIERAVESAARALDEDELESVGPVLQSIALPSTTREAVRADKELLKGLRAALVDRMPEATEFEPENITRFSVRTILTLTLTVVAVVAIVTTVNADEITSALADANPVWAVLTFVLGGFSWLGAAITLMAFSPARLPFLRTLWTQVAGSFVAIAAPAGIGPAALNMRLLTKRGVSTSLGLATVALVQLSQFAVTIGILVVLSLATGDGGLVSAPSTTVMVAIGALAMVVAGTLLVPAVRRWVLARVRPTLEQVWPRLSAVLGQPLRLLSGLAGSFVLTMSYVLAFYTALLAFGQHLDLVDVAVVYLVGNAAGAAVPTPGGIGAIEAALILGLTTAGVSAPIATSVTVLFRVATYWLRIPIGWVFMRWLQRQGDL
ncbi:lysylphosphatidylglycerol synthase transmembrane domain-containing protein [Luteimicrobium subarcticum]|uniref:Uncharacterized protein (TIRG00374 family) n=1 Tax=Luteimicrobium subarcticum TaxID=620910 RepID=A0A2M8WRS4_9MICO|nr:lysylphosphatidylglycerol synthase transmembrane domain-containing protein [Luteimicrobium subarcticum]PJI93645.1 uncharacterized protein (TIRG00374 family) [Luteimicrobium subarcticum]